MHFYIICTSCINVTMCCLWFVLSRLLVQVPSGEVVTFSDDNFLMLEKIGIEEARRAAFVLVAGGLGERLGYKGIKVIFCSNTYNSQNRRNHPVHFIYLFTQRSTSCFSFLTLYIFSFIALITFKLSIRILIFYFLSFNFQALITTDISASIFTWPNFLRALSFDFWFRMIFAFLHRLNLHYVP